ncbi:glycosyltransferase [Vibrio splendidus]
MRKIYLITNQFPYSFSEQFLETELKFWEGSELEIVPTRLEGGIRDTGNVSVKHSIASRMGNYNKLDLSHIIKTAFSSYLWKELIRSPRLFISAGKLKNLLRFEYLTQRYSTAILKEFSRDELSNALFYTYWFSWNTCALTRLKNKYGFKIVTRCHRVDLYSYAQPSGYMPYNKIYYKEVDLIYSISDDGAQYLHDAYGIEPEKVVVSRLGVPERTTLPLVSNKPTQTINVLSVSYVKPVKRVLLIAEMLKKYAIDNPSISINWTHFGDGPEFSQLKSLTEDAGLTVKLMGMKENFEVINYYEKLKIDVFINLSLSEGIPVSIMEAISFGVPIVATDCGGTKEIVDDSVGLLLDISFSYEEFQSAMKLALQKKSQAIVLYFKRNYCAEINYKNFKEELLLLASKGVFGKRNVD